jgi:hypothetical protein
VRTLDETEYFAMVHQGKTKLVPRAIEEERKPEPPAPAVMKMPEEMMQMMDMLTQQHKECMTMMKREVPVPVVNVTVKEPKEKPEIKKRWEFAVHRNSSGLIETVTAKEIETEVSP